MSFLPLVVDRDVEWKLYLCIRVLVHGHVGDSLMVNFDFVYVEEVRYDILLDYGEGYLALVF